MRCENNRQPRCIPGVHSRWRWAGRLLSNTRTPGHFRGGEPRAGDSGWCPRGLSLPVERGLGELWVEALRAEAGPPLPAFIAGNAIHMQMRPKSLSSCSKICFIHSIFPSGLSHLGLSGTLPFTGVHLPILPDCFPADTWVVSLHVTSSKKASLNLPKPHSSVLKVPCVLSRTIL